MAPRAVQGNMDQSESVEGQKQGRFHIREHGVPVILSTKTLEICSAVETARRSSEPQASIRTQGAAAGRQAESSNGTS
jgi:hypothetical protein